VSKVAYISKIKGELYGDSTTQLIIAVELDTQSYLQISFLLWWQSTATQLEMWIRSLLLTMLPCSLIA